MGRYARGAGRERQLQRQLEGDGWVVTRCAGSKGEGAYDLHASKLGESTRLIQVKASARSAFSDFPPAERRELAGCALRAGAQAWLVWHPPDRKGVRWIAAADWPTRR